MPDAPTPSIQQLAVLVGSYLAAIEDIAAADRAALEAARKGSRCLTR